MKDYYKVLGISKTATDEEIKKAYKKLSLKYHPDRPKGDEEKFKELNEAYEILSDPIKRVQYNQGNQNPSGNRPEDGDYYHESRQGPANFTFRRPAGNNMTGTPNGFSFSRFMNGNAFANNFFGGNPNQQGFDNIFEEAGMGFPFNETHNEPNRQILQLNIEDMYRGGNQKISYGDNLNVDGQTYTVPETLNLKIPPKCPVGKTFKLTIPSKKESDREKVIMIVIKPRKHKFYNFRGDSTVDLETNVSLSLKDSLVGFRLRLPGIDGDEIIVEEDEVIDPRTPYKLTEKGYYNKNGKRGDLYIIFNIKYPTKLTSTQKQAIKNAFK